MMDKLKVVPYQFDRDTEVLSLLHKVFRPWMGDETYFNWKYKKLEEKDCDFPRGWIIEKDGKIIAFNGYVPRLIKLGNQEFWSAQSFDTATDPAYRGLGLFGILQNNVYEEMRHYHIKWVYGWTSDIGFKVFTQKVGWKIWNYQKFLMKVINVKKFVGQKIQNPLIQNPLQVLLSGLGKFAQPGISSKIEVREEESLPESVDRLCEKVCQNFGMIAIRNSSYLKWRFSHPTNTSRVLCAYKNQLIRGYVILTEREQFLEIDDCLTESSGILRALLSKIEDIARKEEKEVIRFRVNKKHPYAGILKRAGYFWSKTSFPMLGRKLVEHDDFSFDIKNLHWTLFDRNE